MNKQLPEMILMVGNIGCGKSSLAYKLVNCGYVIINMDSIQQSLSGGDYGKYDINKKTIYKTIEETAIKESLKAGFSVCIDCTNMDKKRRARFINIGQLYTNKILCFNFGYGKEKHLQRRLKNSRGITKEKWKEVFNFMKNSYEEPTLDEGFIEILNIQN